MIDDLLVVGGGPAGRALAVATARCGLRTTLLDPAPDRPWRVTYGAWAAELPADLPASVIAARARGRAVALTDRPLGWEYAVLDVPAFRAHLDAELTATGVSIRPGRALTPGHSVASDHPVLPDHDHRLGTKPVIPDGISHRGADHDFGSGGVLLADGSVVRARVVVDAGGRRQPLAGWAGPHPGALDRLVPTRHAAVPAEQTAYGLIVDEAVAGPLVAPGEALFMDWRRDHGEPGWPTFLYAIPLGRGRVLLEETSLARRPGLPLSVLQRRLYARLAHHGITPPPDAAVEKVHFPVDTPRHRGLGFGAAAPLVHPATGFSVAESLRLAPALAQALAMHLPGDPARASAAARRVLWPPAARVVHSLRRIGLEAVLAMPAEQVPAFFEVFFGLPDRHRWAYLTGRSDVRGLAGAMAALYARADWPLRARLIGPALRPALRENVR